jgi:hypothetical protein
MNLRAFVEYVCFFFVNNIARNAFFGTGVFFFYSGAYTTAVSIPHGLLVVIGLS